MTEQVYLNIDSQRIYGWQDVSVFHSMDAIAPQFDVSYTDPDQNFIDVDLQLDTDVSLWLGNDQIIAARIEDIAPSYDDKSHSIAAAGRGPAGDLVDCAYDVDGAQNKQFRKQKLDVIASELCRPFGIKVIVDRGVDVGEPLTQTIDEGESIWSFLDQLARYRAVRFMSDLQGNLHITKPGLRRSQTVLAYGVNIKGCAARYSLRDIYSSYTVLSQLAGVGVQQSPNAVARQLGRELDQRYSGRHRPFVAMSDRSATSKECETRAKFERRTRAGRSQSVVYTLNGWRDEQGELWQINTLVSIQDPIAGINGERLISEVRYIESDGGRECQLTVKPLSAFDLKAEDEPDSVKFYGTAAQ